MVRLGFGAAFGGLLAVLGGQRVEASAADDGKKKRARRRSCPRRCPAGSRCRRGRCVAVAVAAPPPAAPDGFDTCRPAADDDGCPNSHFCFRRVQGGDYCVALANVREANPNGAVGECVTDAACDAKFPGEGPMICVARDLWPFAEPRAVCARA